jgi:putrescine aminotransferase
MTKSMPNLFSWEECRELDISKIHELYRNYVNSGQVDLISTFGFGRTASRKAEGMYIHTVDGRTILDFTGGIGVLNHGHNHPRILAARRKFQDQLNPEVHKNFLSQYVAGLSYNIAQLLPEDLNISYFCNSGAESVEGAVKLAFKYHAGKRRSIARADIAFHGKLLGAAGLTGSPELRFSFPTIPSIKTYEYNDIGSVKTLVDISRQLDGQSDLFAIILEPFNASSLRQCDSEFLRQLRNICSQENIVLIFDEVYTGWAKSGSLFYFMKHSVTPDILTYAKSFGGGKASIAGYTTRPSFFERAYGNLADSILHSTTYNGFGEETITAIEAINIVVEEDYVARSEEIYDRLNTGLRALQKKYPSLIDEVRGSGALNGIVLNKNIFSTMQSVITKIPNELLKDERFVAKLITSSVISELFNGHNILTFYGDNREIPLIFSPSLIVTDREIDRLLTSIDQVLSMGKLKLLTKFIIQKWGS